MSNADFDAEEAEIQVEEVRLAHLSDLRAHRRTLIWIIIMLLIVHALYALALVTIAKRCVVVSFSPNALKTFSPENSEETNRGPRRLLKLEAGAGHDFRGRLPAVLGRTLAGGMYVAARQEGQRRRARTAKPGPRSRDWEPSDVRCLVSYCPCNRKGHCILPSQIDIGPDGRCRTAGDFKTSAPKPTPVSGD